MENDGSLQEDTLILDSDAVSGATDVSSRSSARARPRGAPVATTSDDEDDEQEFLWAKSLAPALRPVAALLERRFQDPMDVLWDTQSRKEDLWDLFQSQQGEIQTLESGGTLSVGTLTDTFAGLCRRSLFPTNKARVPGLTERFDPSEFISQVLLERIKLRDPYHAAKEPHAEDQTPFDLPSLPIHVGLKRKLRTAVDTLCEESFEGTLTWHGTVSTLLSSPQEIQLWQSWGDMMDSVLCARVCLLQSIRVIANHQYLDPRRLSAHGFLQGTMFHFWEGILGDGEQRRDYYARCQDTLQEEEELEGGNLHWVDGAE